MSNSTVSQVPQALTQVLDTVRAPDYYSLNVNIAIPNPLTETFVGVTGQMTLDRNWNVYGGVGLTFGKSATFVSGSLTAGWLLQKDKPSPEELENFSTGHSANVGAGYWGSAGVTTSFPSGTTAIEVGVVTPQVGESYHYSSLFGVRI